MCEAMLSRSYYGYMDPPIGFKWHDLPSHPKCNIPGSPALTGTHANLSTQIAFFTHVVQTKGNSICFAHHSLCSPKISTLLKAI